MWFCLTHRRTFKQYRDGAYANYPAIADLDQFENDLMTFLNNRRINDSSTEPQTSSDRMDGMSMRWISLLFAVFASGVQFSGLAKNDRELLSQVYSLSVLSEEDEDAC